MVFDEGRRPTRSEMRRIYEEGAHLAKALSATLRDRVRKQKSLPPPQPALPEPAAEAKAPAVPETEPAERA
jgi:hypothetical protein